MNLEDHNQSADASAAGAGELRNSEAGFLGMVLFLVSLGVLFAASMAGYLVLRLRAESWPPPGAPDLPAGLWASTGLILLTSGAVQYALAGARKGLKGRLNAGLWVTLGLSIAFLAVQIYNWYALYHNILSIEMPPSARLFPSTFYLLTVLHALHVIGGMVLLVAVILKTRWGVYTSTFHPGVRYAAMYWHFLDAVWIVMFVLLVLTI